MVRKSRIDCRDMALCHIGGLDEIAYDALIAHAEECAQCRQMMADMRGSARYTEVADELPEAEKEIWMIVGYGVFITLVFIAVARIYLILAR